MAEDCGTANLICSSVTSQVSSKGKLNELFYIRPSITFTIPASFPTQGLLQLIE